MQVFITGATGLVGRRIVLDRLERGDRVVVLSRRGPDARKLFAADANPNVTVVEGNPATPGAWQDAVDGCDAVIHLAGAGVADKRWNAAYKKILVQSRVDSTYQVVRAIDAAATRPRVLICASGAGYYGETGDNAVDEAGPPGDDFLALLTQQWEAQAIKARGGGTRVIILRIGALLDARGGMLGKLLPIFRLGLGGPWGSGRQYLPWIHWRDLVGLVGFGLARGEADGVYNATAPNPVTVKVFARALGRALGRPALLPVPGPAMRLAAGELAYAMLMSNRVVPARAEADGYRFMYTDLDETLRSLVGRSPSVASASPAPSETPPTPRAAAGSDPGSSPGSSPRSSKSPAIDPGDTAPPAPVRLLAVDVAGTLIRNGAVAGGVVQACRAAERAGCVVVLATARPPRGLRQILSTLGITGPTINYNGAVIWNPVTDEAQHHAALDSELAQRIVTDTRALKPELLVGVEVLDRAYTDRIDRDFEREVGVVVEPDFIGPLDSAFTAPVTRLDLAGPRDRIDAVVKMLRDRYWKNGDIALYRTEPHLVQVVHPMADKSIALQRIASKLGVDNDAVMVIGEGENDTGMLEWAGFSVVVDNACSAARELADATVSNDDGLGVARAIQRYVLLGRASTAAGIM